MTTKDPNPQARPTATLAALVRELGRARREVGRFPGQPRLRHACVRDLESVARTLVDARPHMLQIADGEVRYGAEVLWTEPPSYPLFRTLAHAGATGLLLAPPLAGAELLRFVETVLAAGESGGGSTEGDVVQRLRAAEIPGIVLLFGPLTEGTGRSPQGKASDKGLADPAASRVAGSAARLVRASLERDFGRSLPLAVATALLEASDEERLAIDADTLACRVQELLRAVLREHDVHATLALLEQSDRSRGLGEEARDGLHRILDATVDESWITTALASPSRAQAAALGVLVLRCAQLLPRVLRCAAALADAAVAHELALIARLNPEPFAQSAASAEVPVRDAARALLRQAGHGELG